MVEKLLKAGAKADLAQGNGVTPLMTAARTGSPEVVTLLLARRVNVNALAGRVQERQRAVATEAGKP